MASGFFLFFSFLLEGPGLYGWPLCLPATCVSGKPLMTLPEGGVYCSSVHSACASYAELFCQLLCLYQSPLSVGWWQRLVQELSQYCSVLWLLLLKLQLGYSVCMVGLWG